MTWLLIIVLWHGDAMTSKTIEVYSEKTCEVAAAKVRQEFLTRHPMTTVKVATVCIDRRGSYRE